MRVRITVFEETPVIPGLFRDLTWAGAPGEMPGHRDLARRLVAHAAGAAALGRTGPGARWRPRRGEGRAEPLSVFSAPWCSQRPADSAPQRAPSCRGRPGPPAQQRQARVRGHMVDRGPDPTACSLGFLAHQP